MFILYIALFCVSLLLWLSNKRAASLFCFILFLEDGLYIIPKELEGIKLTHMAFAYIIVMLVINFPKIKRQAKIHSELSKKLIWLCSFFIVSILFSILYYNFPAGLCFTTGMRYLILLSFFVFLLGKREDYKKIFNWIYYITLITTILYIGQCLFGVQLLVYNLEHSGGALSNGLYRWYNFPPFGEIFLYITFFYPTLIHKRLRLISFVVFPLALLLSNGRGAIISAGVNFLIISYLTGNLKQNFKAIIIAGSLLFFVSGYVFERMNHEGKTKEDLELILSGNFSQADYQSRNGYTMLYRLAWIKERWDYLKERPFVEPLFGLGMILDESKSAKNNYRFRFGLVNKVDGTTAQIRTPDIAWGNFLTCYGLLGTFLFFVFYFSLWKKIHNYSKNDILAKIVESNMIVILLSSFTGSSISEPYMMSMFLFWYAVIYRNTHKYDYCTHRIRVGKSDA